MTIDDGERLSVLADAAAVPRLRAQFTRRRFIAAAVSLGAATGLAAACGSGGDGSTPEAGKTSATGGQVESNLSVYSWSGYNPPDVVDAFTKQFSTDVTFDTYGSNDEMVAKLSAAKGTAGYDLVVPSGPYLPQMIQNGLLAPLNKQLLPNFSNMDPTLLNQEWDPKNEYSVCRAWGTTGYAYDKSVISRPMTTWADFLEAATHEASGKTSVIDDGSALCGLYFWSHGIDWNTEDPAQLQAAEDYLVGTLAKHISAFDSNAGTNAIPTASAALMQGGNGDFRQGILASSEPDRWQWVLPGPKTEIWMDVWALAEGAPHPEAAHAYLNYSMLPDSLLQFVEFVGYNSGGQDIKQKAEQKNLPLLDMIFMSPAQIATMSPSLVTDALAKRVEIWTKVKSAAGA